MIVKYHYRGSIDIRYRYIQYDMGGKIKTDFLFSSPSFASGAGRLLDWGGTFDRYNVSANGKEADAKAMLADWVLVGDDIALAMDEFDDDRVKSVK